MTTTPPADSPVPSRRSVLKVGGGAAALGLTAPQALATPHVGHRETLRVGLIGAGGRGSGAAIQALRADPHTKLVAIGDAFQDHIVKRLKAMQKNTDVAARIDVPAERQFAGFDAYLKVLEMVDVVILATPPHFRPLHFKEAVSRGIHCFVEKPVACDAPGVRSIIETCKLARQKKVAVVSGLCYRYHKGRRRVMEEIHGGRIGEIVAMNANYITNGLWSHKRQPGWSDMEFQMRNWLYYTWLAGDHIAEQHIHSLDVMAWAMKDEYPESALSLGGRQTRTDPLYGHVYDHFSTIYQWKNGVKGFSNCRQQLYCHREVNDYIMGQAGTANVFRHAISGEKPWRLSRKELRGVNMYQTEHDEMFASIRSGQPIDNGEYMWKSTLMAIMGRMSAYTGKQITWEQALNSKEDLSPEKYAWGPLPVPEVAMPGRTRFV